MADAEHHVLLWGPPGSGKSAVGPLLASALGRPFIETNAAIEAEAKRSIAELFAADGELAFRRRERALIEALLDSSPPKVIALGGGALVAPDLRDAALSRALVVRLDAPLATLVARLESDRVVRPLLKGDLEESLGRLLIDRATAYQAFHLAVDAAADSAEIAARVAARIASGYATIHTPATSYAAWLAPGQAAKALSFVIAGLRPSSVHVVVDAHVHELFGGELLDAMDTRVSSLHRVGPGESAKGFGELERLLGELLDAGIDRSSVIVAVGGGATSDLAGLAAGLVARGVRWVAAPTTLLGMVDAAIGGKTAVNLGGIKNPVGVFHHPSAVVIDPRLTATEPDRSYRSAISEIIKTAIIGDADLFEALATSPQALVDRDPAAMDDAVLRCMTVKARVVTQDPDEKGVRVLLNLGHTVGHALEAESAGSLLHGEAIAMGLEAALELGVLVGVTPPNLRDRAVAALRNAGLPPLSPLSPRAFERLAFDKKRRGSRVQLVVARAPGCAEVLPIDVEELRAKLRKLGSPTTLP
ncbi:MAG: iron-containing alcohol dehydrogenase [Polyangiaceae bacterium]|nr:iron-containing alcohol dehydrogenase [Polyangiaceae bacterium]